MRLDPENIYYIITALILQANELKTENKELKRRLAKYETPKTAAIVQFHLQKTKTVLNAEAYERKQVVNLEDNVGGKVIL